MSLFNLHDNPRLNTSKVSLVEYLVLLTHLKRIKCPVLKFLARKIRAFDAVKDHVHTLILGSSHAQMGWVAERDEFNMGLGYQDLYYTYHLYKRYMDCPNLKNIVVFYSVFSQGHQLIRTRDARACVSFKVVAGIEYSNVAMSKALHLGRLEGVYSRKAKRWQGKHPAIVGDLGNENDYIPALTPSAKDRALPHLKNNRRDFDMTAFVNLMATEMEKRGQKLFVVIPPATFAYRQALPGADVLFSRIRGCMSRLGSAKLMNHYEDDDFLDDGDFIDWDHLSRKGAIKLTAKIRSEMGL